MADSKSNPEVDAYQFILEHIDSIPHLEALILLWNSRPVGWTQPELASRLYVGHDQVGQIIRDLVRLQFVQEQAGAPPKFSYNPRSEEQNEVMQMVDNAYRRDLVRISTMVHSKASSSVREFARAFRFRKDRES
ncbi:MAG: hypothetical protein ACLGSD_13325 [Acidobacteriota bacterium]